MLSKRFLADDIEIFSKCFLSNEMILSEDDFTHIFETPVENWSLLNYFRKCRYSKKEIWKSNCSENAFTFLVRILFYFAARRYIFKRLHYCYANNALIFPLRYVPSLSSWLDFLGSTWMDLTLTLFCHHYIIVETFLFSYRNFALLQNLLL